MRNLIDIMHMPHIVITDVYRDRKGNPVGLAGWCEFPDKKFKGTLICGFNEDGMEHVSVSSYKKRQLPDWETMCRIKDAFWQDEEMDVQIHPKKSEYLHGVSTIGGDKLENVLHLWRPADGDWSRIEPKAVQNGSLNAEFAKKLRNRPTNGDYSAMYGQILQSDCDQLATHCINRREKKE